MEAYIHDIVAVVSFGLNATCTVSEEDALRLISRERSTKVGSRPSAFVPRVFDQEIAVSTDELQFYVEFVRDLIALERKYFLEAMRAIRTYVVALHRLADDLELSYTLFVASIESLAQSFDRIEPVWPDYDEVKRAKIDRALADADKNTALKVRAVLLEVDKTAIGRKFREFAKMHLQPAFFREEAEGVESPISRADLDQALRAAYQIRSDYIHRLRELPRMLAAGGLTRGEAIRAEGRTQLTFRGLARLARHIILGFVRDQPKLNHESYDYHLERHGIVTVEFAPHYWVARTEGLRLSAGIKRLEGFLEQLSSHFSNEKDAVVTDLRPVLTKAEQLMASGNEENRRPFLALYILFNAHMSRDQRLPNAEEIERTFGEDLQTPSIESLLVHMILRARPNWTLADYQRIIDRYFDQRNNSNGLRLPRTFEASILLNAAEHCRLTAEYGRAQEMLSKATECHPGHKPLQVFENDLHPDQTIDWLKIVFSRSNDEDADT